MSAAHLYIIWNGFLIVLQEGELCHITPYQTCLVPSNESFEFEMLFYFFLSRFPFSCLKIFPDFWMKFALAILSLSKFHSNITRKKAWGIRPIGKSRYLKSFFISRLNKNWEICTLSNFMVFLFNIMKKMVLRVDRGHATLKILFFSNFSFTISNFNGFFLHFSLKIAFRFGRIFYMSYRH